MGTKTRHNDKKLHEILQHFFFFFFSFFFGSIMYFVEDGSNVEGGGGVELNQRVFRVSRGDINGGGVRDTHTHTCG